MTCGDIEAIGAQRRKIDSFTLSEVASVVQHLRSCAHCRELCRRSFAALGDAKQRELDDAAKVTLAALSRAQGHDAELRG